MTRRSVGQMLVNESAGGIDIDNGELRNPKRLSYAKDMLLGELWTHVVIEECGRTIHPRRLNLPVPRRESEANARDNLPSLKL
jgi:hypothetical protein